MIIDKQKLINQATPDGNISDKQTIDPRLYRAIKNLGDSERGLINATFPPLPIQSFEWRIIIPGNPVVANDVLDYHYHVILPTDPLNYWSFIRVNLIDCFITAKVAPAAGNLSLDVKVSQLKGTGTFKSLFQETFNPVLPINKESAHNVKFAINSLFQDDILRVDVLVTDGTVSGIELVLVGYFILSEN